MQNNDTGALNGILMASSIAYMQGESKVIWQIYRILRFEQTLFFFFIKPLQILQSKNDNMADFSTLTNFIVE